MPRKALQSHLDPTLVKLIHASLPPKQADRYIRMMRHWLKHKGKEWLAGRIKALWNMALLERSGQAEQIPGVASASRIGCDETGYPRGLEGQLIRNYGRLRKPCKLRQASVAFRAYTALRLDETSVAQRSKAQSSITSPRDESLDRTWVVCLPVVEPWLCHRSSVRSRKMIRLDSLNRLSGTSRYPSLLRVPTKAHEATPFLTLAASLATMGYVPQPLITALGDLQMRRDAERFQCGCEPPICGQIGVIQEGGAKARVVAMPTAWIQYYCMPYHNHIAAAIRRLEAGEWLQDGYQYGMSCAFHQTVGVSMALVALKQQQFCAAVDLSSATDRFPLDLQKRTCSLLNIYEFGEALDDLRGPWKGIPDSSGSREMWSYAVGQPMGLYGSFPLFHLTHYLLLNSLAHSLRLPADGRNFAVLGDDVLLFNEELRTEYVRALQSLGVPVSQHKCYEGDLVEFAGFLITKSGASATAFRPYKHDSKARMGEGGKLPVLNACHAIGSTVAKWGPYWKRAYDSYVATRGLRDLTLDPLTSDPDETPYGSSGLPGSRWIGACLNQACYRPLDTVPPSQNFVQAHWARLMDSWERERFQLLKEVELLTDIGHKGVTDPSNFDPSQYTLDEAARKRAKDPWRSFARDPLIRELRNNQDGTAGNS